MFSSNFIEILTNSLKRNLFFKGVKSQVYIFVANRFVKNYLMKSIADDPDLKVSFGLNFVNISNFLNFFQSKLNISKKKRFLNFLELNFLIRKKIEKHITKPLSDSSYLVLYNYLIKDGKILEKRFTKLCLDLSEIYLKYTIYENEKSLIKKSKIHWQIKLFLEIFYEDGYSAIFRDLKKVDIKSLKDVEFHFFSINYMPAIYFDFIHRFPNVFHYFLSPTAYFFEDFLSNLERENLKKHLIKKQKPQKFILELDSYLKDRNSFLANMEKLKRNYLKIFSSYDDIEISDEYKSFSQKNNHLDTKATFLNVFQNDILNLVNREKDMKILDKIDDSIQIHVATSKFREVQILYSNILNLLKNNKDLKLCDIHVISENIDEYVPYVDMVFADDILNYKISDLKITDESLFISGFEKFIELANSRFEKEKVLDLFENPLFMSSHKFSIDEIKTLFKWIEKANISWGLDEEHILKFLKDSDLIILKSFEKGLFRIVLSAVFVLNQDFLASSFLFDHPISELEISDLNILDKFLKTLISIQDDLKIIEDKKKLTLEQWHKYLKDLSMKHFKDFFQNSLNSYIDNEKFFTEKIAFGAFQDFLKDLQNVSLYLDQETFSFEMIFEHLKKYLSKLKTQRNANAIEAIHFSSFELSYLRAEVVFILGLDNESFQIKPKSSIDISSLNDVPSNVDYKRSLFLQSLLSAKKCLILSYISKENHNVDRAIFLEEFLSYLDRSYILVDKKPSKCIIKKHPPFSFHKSYFSKANENFSHADFKAAKIYYHKSLNKNFMDVKPIDINIESEEEKIVNLYDLKKLCKNPISFYFNKMDIYLEKKIEKNDFQISNLDKYIIKNAAIDGNIKDILVSFEKKAKMPFGIFKDIAKNKITSDVLMFLKNLKDLDVDFKNLKNIEFTLDVKDIIQMDEKNILMPPIQIRVNEKLIKIIGKVQNISNKGLLSHLDESLYNQIRCWPDILILNKLDKSFEKKVIFTKSKTIKSYQIDKVDDYLAELIKYYDLSQKEIFFLIKPFCEHILNKDENLLDKMLQKIDKKNLLLDVYTFWYFKNFEKPKAKSIIEKAKIFINVFKPLLE